MHDLKDLLDREASRVQPEMDGLDSVLRRAERRHRNRRVAAGALGVMVSAALALGSYAGIRVLGGSDGPTPAQTPTVAPPGTDEAWEGIWPQETRAEAAFAQQRADARDPRYLWQLEPPTVAERFVISTLTDDDQLVSGFRLGERAHGRPVVVRVLVCDPQIFQEAQLIDLLEMCDRREAVDVTLEQPIRSGSTGTWVVTDYGDLPSDYIENYEESLRRIKRLQERLGRNLGRALDRTRKT